MCASPLSADWEPVPLHALPPLASECEAQAWLLPLDDPPLSHRTLADSLSPDERERAARFHFEHDRRRFEAARGLLRWLLAQQARLAPAEIDFCLGDHGKPALHPRHGDLHLSFNVSHSGPMALVGLMRGSTIGVDIELRRDVPEYEAIAASNFAPEERRELARLPSAQRLDAFFAGWTRKEAYIKAVGDGLHAPLDRFVVTVDPQQPPRLQSIAGSARAAAAWTLWAARADAQAWAAVAVPRRGVRVRTFSLVSRPPEVGGPDTAVRS